MRHAIPFVHVLYTRRNNKPYYVINNSTFICDFMCSACLCVGKRSFYQDISVRKKIKINNNSKHLLFLVLYFFFQIQVLTGFELGRRIAKLSFRLPVIVKLENCMDRYIYMFFL
uniref:Uncharacterized protein n=1 Tax=Schizaphis graminum TaxID=13262 RepID=A0A2S2P9C3_SCHGA